MSGIRLTEVDDATIATPPAGKSTLILDDVLGWAHKDDDGITRSLQGEDGVLTYLDHGNTGSTETVTASAADIQRLVANAATVTLTLNGWPAAGTPGIIRLWLEQDGTGGRDWAFPGSVEWGDAGEPVWTDRSAGEVDLVDLTTVDGGTTILATVAGRAGPPGSGSMATDSIWDAAGDIVQGTGANTAARLALGTASQQLRVNAGATALEYFTPAGAAAFVGVLANRTTDQTIATGGAVVSFNAADTYDTNTFHDPGGANPSRLIVPTAQDGKYVITGYLIWSAAAYGANTIKQARIYKNGAGTGWAQTNDGNFAGFQQQVVTTPPLDLVATDYIELFAAHDRGSDGTISGSVVAIKLGMYRVG